MSSIIRQIFVCNCCASWFSFPESAGKQRSNARLFCSRECSDKWRADQRRFRLAMRNFKDRKIRAERAANHQCGQCGKAMNGLHQWSRSYCNDCRVARMLRQKTAKYHRERGSDKPIVKMCCRCTKEFVCGMGSKRVGSKYCSGKCIRAACAERRRARINGVAYEPINIHHLMLRDGGCCQMCGVRVHLWAGKVTPTLATVDHIWPISRGGSHTLSNIQLACFTCNSRKGDRVSGVWKRQSVAR